MPQLNISKLLRRLAERPASAAVFLHGDEEYLREEAIQRALELLLDPSTRDFNLDQLRGSETSPEALASMLATPPMMADYRIVVVRDAQGLTPKAREAVEEAVARQVPGVILLLSATIPGGSKAKFYGALKKEALSVEFVAVDPMELPGWLIERAAEVHEVEIELEAARALSAAIGSQLGVLSTELEKAVSYIGDRKTITLDDVKAVGGYIPRVDRWAWFDSVGDRRFEEALGDLPELLDTGENGVGLVIGIGSHLLKIGLLASGGRAALERHLRPNQRWLANRLQSQARKWTVEQIDGAMEELLRSDRLLKSASMTDRQAIEELLLRLALAESPSRGAERRLARAG
ncbi:MAG: DNA polymerase III subunit delta [Gemmatimonadota bacterium]